MHIYAFGSICRGEMDASSDVDMLAIVDGQDQRFNPNDYSIYSYERIRDLWLQGNPFAWHLYLESKLVFSSDDLDFIKEMGRPSAYRSGLYDCHKFHEIFLSAKCSVEQSNLTEIFDLSSIFLGIRNFATCYSLHEGIDPDFSRYSARNLGHFNLKIDKSVYKILERARILSTRGSGKLLSSDEIKNVKAALGDIDSWMTTIICSIEDKAYE
ncbi:MAG: nucleotidyltransferase domain-containing protein [Gammaproteobacteria bacterium]|nr:nucleotidyltransferase domain-containing protein [Gammaproteobacteria bacterium]